MTKKKYQFKHQWHQYHVGDPVPAEFDDGTVGTLLQYHHIEEVKAFEKPWKTKVVRPATVCVK